MNSNIAIIVIAFNLVIGVGAVAMIVYVDRQKRAEKKQGITRPNKRLLSVAQYYKIFNWYESFFLFRGGITKIHARISELSVYTSQESRIMAVKFYSTSVIVYFVITLMGIIVFKDILMTLLVFLFATVIKISLVDKSIDNIHFKLLKQLLKALSSVRQNYLRLGVIPDSIAEAEAESLLHRSFEDIYLILTAVDGEQRLSEFYASTPFKLLQTFAGVCYLLNNSGDSKLADGSSNFIQAMGMMSAEVQMEVQKLTLQKATFGVLEYLPLAPLIALKIIESFFSGVIPGTSIIYNGSIGYISRTLIVMASILGYMTITKINSAVIVKKDDRSSIVMSLLEFSWFQKLVSNLKPKKLKKLDRKNRILRDSLSMTDINHIYGAKVLYTAVAFALSIFFMFFSVELGRDFIYENVREVSLVAGEELDAKDIDIRRKMDKIYLSYTKVLNHKKTLAFVDHYLPGMSEFDRQAQVQRLITKYNSYHNTYFKWWMIVISYLIAWGAWFLPEIFLKVRAWLLKTEAEEDVLQLQTIITILMNTNVDTMETLYWMERQSRVHKNALFDAYHEYPSDPEFALNKLKARAFLPEFKRMIDKLILTIHQITLAEAFSDLVSEREHVLRLREISQRSVLKKKRAFASPLAMLPVALTAVLYLLVPLGILGFKEFTTALQNLNM
jgi:hypothetical protein